MINKKSSLTTPYVIIFGILLLVTNILLGVILIIQSRVMIKDMVDNSMINVAKTAASLIDGDVFESLEKEDEGGEKFNQILERLSSFQNNANIVYIYTVRQCGDNEYMFVVDADPDKPASLGAHFEDQSVTAAFISATKGTAAVDDEAVADAWGKYYSCYSPISNSAGKVTGVVGVDFDSDWYESQTNKFIITTIVVSILFILVGIVIIILINARVQARFKKLDSELVVLSNDVDELKQEFISDSGYLENPQNEGEKQSAENVQTDEIGSLSSRVRDLHTEMKQYLDLTKKQASTDSLTLVNNSNAYIYSVNQLNEKIKDNTANFHIVIYDINNLKQVNDTFGHAWGDRLIKTAAKSIAKGFGSKRTYRIGGDEFVVLVEDVDDNQMDKLLSVVKKEVNESNKSLAENNFILSMSEGSTAYDPEKDKSYEDVFIRADTLMYTKKDDYHKNNGQ